LQGIQSVKAFTNEFFEMARYRVTTQEIAQTGIKNGRLRGAFSSFIILGLFGAMTAVIWKGSTLLATGEIDTGQLFSFVIYTVFIGGTIGGMADVFARVQKFIGATEDLMEIFNETPEPLEELPLLAPYQILHGGIRFDHLSFSYPTRMDMQVLSDIHVEIKPDTLVALVGPSGAGKSTMVSLLLRLYEPVSGHVLFDDTDNLAIPLSVLRGQMAIVPQDIFLFGGTIRENIAYGKPNASEEEIIAAAKAANAHGFISEFPDGYNTRVGERGVTLSGGQKQRVAIARSLLINPRILILDDSTSSVDTKTEYSIQQALSIIMRGRTTFIIAQRLNSVKDADQILVLKDGEIIEQGRHEQLLALNGYYAETYRLQLADQEKVRNELLALGEIIDEPTPQTADMRLATDEFRAILDEVGGD